MSTTKIKHNALRRQTEPKPEDWLPAETQQINHSKMWLKLYIFIHVQYVNVQNVHIQ